MSSSRRLCDFAGPAGNLFGARPKALTWLGLLALGPPSLLLPSLLISMSSSRWDIWREIVLV